MGESTTYTRRRFLALAGGVAGTAALACCGLGWLAARQPETDVQFAESTCGEGEGGDRMLVTYASRCGSTGEVAEAIGRALCAAGAAVDVRKVEDVADVSAYRAVVVGSAVYRTQLMPAAVEFVEAHRGALQQVPVACFVVCGTMARDVPDRSQAAAFLDPVRAVVQPVAEGFFAGVIDYGKVSFFEQLILRALGSVEGDFRDWDAIRTWAAGLPATMLGG